MTGTVSFSMYDPSSLFGGAHGPVHRSITYAGAIGALVKRGTLLGRVSSGTAGAPAAKTGNTGIVTITMDGTTPVQAGATSGVYRIVWTDATHFTVYDPNGDQIGTGTNSGGFNGQIKFTVGTPSPAMVANDEYDVTVSSADKYVVSKATATDGSQQASGFAVSAIDVDLTGGTDTVGPAYFHGEFAAEVMIFDPSWTSAGAEEALRQAGSQIYIKQLGTLG